MHASMKLTCIRTAVAFAFFIYGSGCAPSLPRLQEYTPTNNATDLSQSPHVAWLISDEKNLDDTLVLLNSHPDELVRSHAMRTQAELDRMEHTLENQYQRLLKESLSDAELVTEIGVVLNKENFRDRAEVLVEIREEILSEALDYEKAGKIGEAIRYANALIATDSIILEPENISLIREDPLDVYRRNRDRMNVIRMIDRKLGIEMDQGGSGESVDRVMAYSPDWPVQSEEGLETMRRNLKMILDHIVNEHVSSPDRSELHEAGIDEILFMCEVLDKNGYQIPIAFTTDLDTQIRSMSDGPSDRLLMKIQESEQLLAKDALPPGFSFRVFGDGAVGSLDKQSSIIWPEEFEQYTRGMGYGYRGIGVGIGVNEQFEIELTPMSGGPARKAGIRDGDVVVSVDGIDPTSISIEELTMMASEPDRESLEMRVRHLDGVEETVTIQIGPVRIQRISGWQQIGVDQEGDPEWFWLADPVSRIAYLKPNGFRMNGGRAIRIALQQAQEQASQQGGPLEGLVIDLRGNSGGHVHVAVEMCNLFMREGKAFQSVGRDGELSTIDVDESYGELAGIPLVILLDSESASASELVSGVLKESNNALIIGERSFGKGSVQSLFPCESPDYLARVTGSWYQIPNPEIGESGWTFVDRDKSLQSWGVEPDLEVPISIDERDRISASRNRWFSGVDCDLPQEEEDLKDPEVSLALALIRARILSMRTTGNSAAELQTRN